MQIEGQSSGGAGTSAGTSSGSSGSGASAATSDAFSESGGSQGSSQTSSQGTQAGAGSTSQSATSSGSTNGQQAAAGAVATSWLDSLDPEMREMSFIKNIPDVKTLAKNYANAQALIGADKVVVPGPKSTPEDWKEFHKKIGVPDKVEDYKIEGLEEKDLNTEALTEFKTLMQSQGVLPRQAKEVLGWIDKITTKQQEQVKASREARVAKEMESFKAELGDEYNSTVAAAKLAMNQLSKEDQQYLRDNGLGNNPVFIRAMSQLGKPYQEGKIKGAAGNGSMISREQAIANLDMLKKTPEHPYWDTKHPDHAAARKEGSSWYQVAFDEKKA